MSVLMPQQPPPAPVPARQAAAVSSPGAPTPPGTVRLTFTSGGVDLPGTLYLPDWAGPHPVVVLMHGFPGCGRDPRVPQSLRQAGYAALAFHYRGSGGTGGSWSIAHVLEDAASVTGAIGDLPTAEAHSLDRRRLVVFGHCLGGFAALMTAAAEPSVAAVVAVAAPDIGSAPTTPCAGGADAAGEAEQAGGAWRLTSLGSRLAPRPVLLIGASRDTGTPPALHHHPVVAAYSAHGSPLEHHVFTTGHDLADHQMALTHTVLDFFRRNLPKQ